MKLSTFIESILILYTAWKSFNFFSAYLLEIDQAQLKNQNYGIPLSAWLVFMEFYFYLAIWHLHVQVKVHKESIRTKREISKGYEDEAFWNNTQRLSPAILFVA